MGLANGDLTTVSNYNAYAASPLNQAFLQAAIPRMSRMILTALNRSSLVPRTFVQQFNGNGNCELILPNWPVLKLTSLLISGVTINLAPQANINPPPSNPPWGYRYQPWDGLPPGDPIDLELVGGAVYYPGNQNVVVTYNAGYQVTDEVPNAATYVPLAPYGIWATDQGVTYASSGLALTPVPANTAPSVGQYSPPAPDAATPIYNYSFNVADVASGLLINYGFVPSDLEQACIELISERASYRSRVGVRSQSLAGQETMAYDLSALPPYIMASIRPYMSVISPNIGGNT